MTVPVVNQVDGKAILQILAYVRDFYQNIAKLLLTAEELLRPRGWEPKSAPVSHPAHDHSRLPGFIMRQFQTKSAPTELLTLAAVAFDLLDRKIEQPVLIASRMRPTRTDDGRLDWITQAQIRSRHDLTFDRVLRVSKADLRTENRHRAPTFEDLVTNDELLSLTVPLVEIGDPKTLNTRVLDPLLTETYTR